MTRNLTGAISNYNAIWQFGRDYVETMSNPVVQYMHAGQHNFVMEAWNHPGVQGLMLLSGVGVLARGVAWGIGKFAARKSVINVAAKSSTKLLSQFTKSTLDDAAALTMKQKGTHIFAGKLHPKPYLNELATQMGGRQNVIRSALQNANGRFPSSGIFELPVNVGGSNLTIRGFINNGKPIINTMFR